MSPLVFNKATDDYLFTIAEVRGNINNKLRLRSADDTSILDLNNNGTVDFNNGTTNINSKLFVNSSATCNNTLTVKDSTILENTLNVGGTSTLQNLNAGATDISSILNVAGNVKIGNSQNANLQIGSGLKGGQIYSTATNHELVIDPFIIDGSGSNTLDASGIVTILGDLIVRGNTTTIHSETLTVRDNLIKIADGSTSAGQINDSGIIIGDGYAKLTYNSNKSKWESNIGLIVNGDTTLNNNLNVIGDTFLNSNVNISGESYLNNILDVNGHTSLNNSLSVKGATELSNNLIVDGNTNLNNTLNVVGGTFLNNTLNVSGGSYLNNILDVSGHTSLNSSLSVKGATELSNNLIVDGITNLNNTLNVVGKITATGGLDLSGHLLATTPETQIPVTKSTFALKTSGLNDLSGTTTGWQDATGYNLSKTLLSANSLVKMEFKVNFISSPEADQSLSFRVLKSINGGTDYVNVVFTDENIGSNMGVTIRNVYNGTYIDTPGGTNVAYKLQFKRQGTDIDTSFGIVGGGNYIFLQELYAP